jgi:small subunit ribosomal protein S21
MAGALAKDSCFCSGEWCFQDFYIDFWRGGAEKWVKNFVNTKKFNNFAPLKQADRPHPASGGLHVKALASNPTIKTKNKASQKMIIVQVKEGDNIEKALKKFKRKFEKTGIVKELRSRQAFEKPSVTNRKKMMKAVYVQKLRLVED